MNQQYITGGGSRTLVVPAAFRTIQAALDAARPGDTVQVSAGAYNERLRFKAGVRLLGDGAEKVTVRTEATAAVGFGEPGGGVWR